MRQLNNILEGFGSTILLLLRCARRLPADAARGSSPRFIEQCYLIGYTTLPIVAILSFFIGSVLALQAGYSMQNFGAKQFIGSLVGLSMARELGPLMVAILWPAASAPPSPPSSHR
jgi:phospholipid/cholesterol/gamma-HCH transport system permease protein